MADVPDLLQTGVRETIQALQAEELSLSAQLRNAHRARFRSYREQLRRWFLSYFVLVPNREDEKAPPKQVWDTLKVVRDGLPEEASLQLRRTLGDSFDEDALLLEDALDNNYLVGWQRQLWLLALAGVVISQLPEESPASLDALTRLSHWYSKAHYQTSQQVRAAMLTGGNLPDTLGVLDLQLESLTGRVDALIGNEAFIAARRGADDVLSYVTEAYVDVWLTEDDELVCPICRPLHLTVTTLQPLVDTHPGCRCWKVPVPARYEANPIAYEDYIRQVYA